MPYIKSTKDNLQIGVTGATGKVGRGIVRCLLDHGLSVLSMVRKNREGLNGNTQHALQELEDAGSALFQADFEDYQSLKAFSEQCDVLIHAAYWQVSELEQPEKWIHNNLMGSLNLLDLHRSQGGKQFIFISTCSVYNTALIDTPRVGPYSLIHPRHVYGSYKAAVENFVRAYKYDHGMNYNTSLRPGAPLGLFGFRSYDKKGMWTDEMEHVLKGSGASIHLPKSFVCIDGYDIGAACVELIEKRIREEQTEDVYLQDNGSIDIDVVKNVFKEYSELSEMNFECTDSEEIYCGNISGQTNIFSSNSEKTLHRHIKEWLGIE